MAKNPGALRKCIQAGWGILTNAYVKGFMPGGSPIYTGNLKKICVPGMNCYSCPGALGSCPIGAFYGLFQKVSLVRMQVDEHACVNCGLCAKTCKMNVDPCKNPNSAECIRCRDCINVCPKHALSMGIRDKNAAAKRTA